MTNMKKILIVGSGRSGTTLVQSILCLNSYLFSLKETHFIRKSKRPFYTNYLDRISLDKGRLSKAFQFINDNNEIKGNYDLSILSKRKDLFLFFDMFLSNEANLSNKIGWLEKTPEHINYVEQFLKYIEGIKVIHVIRDGRDVVASLYEACKKYPESWKGFETINKCIYYYNRSILKSLNYIGNKQNFFLNYDQLVETPVNIINQISNFVELDLSVDISNIDSSDRNIIRSEEAWKMENSSNGIHNLKLNKFKLLFSEKEQNLIVSNVISIEEISKILKKSDRSTF